jgi:hypothetical protein
MDYGYGDPAHFLRQNPGHRYSQSPWQPKKTAIAQMREGNNYVIPLSTYVTGPNPYVSRWHPVRRSREEWGRLGQDIGWVTIGTRDY